MARERTEVPAPSPPARGATSAPPRPDPASPAPAPPDTARRALSLGVRRHLALAVCAAAALARAEPCRADGVPRDVSEALAALGSLDAGRVHAARTELGARPEAAVAALEGFAARPALERRERARIIAAALPAENVPRALDLLADPDARVRAALVPLLARPDLPADAAPEPRGSAPDGAPAPRGSAADGAPLPRLAGAAARIERLAALASDDPASIVRRAALEALGTFDDEAAAGALLEVARTGRAGERATAAALLPLTARGAPALHRLVHEGLALAPPAREGDARRPAIAAEVLAVALERHGRWLADGATTEAERAELLVAALHPDPAVRRGALRGFEALLSRLAERAEAEAAAELLADLGAAGLDARVVAYHQARFAMFPGCDAPRALAAARRIRGTPASDGYEARLWHYRSHQLEACAELAAGRPKEAAEAARRAGASLDGILAERGDEGSHGARVRHAEALAARALVTLTSLVAELAAGTPPDGALATSLARDAHVQQLEAQVLMAELTGQALAGLDVLAGDELSPYRLLFHGRPFAALDARTLLALQRDLGRVLATVAPREMPGFAPFERPAGGGDGAETFGPPLDDPRRAALLARVQEARVEGARQALEEIEERLGRERQRGSLVLPEALLEEAEYADQRLRIALRDLESDDDAARLELRLPSSLGLWYARDLAADGQGREARIVAGRVRQDIERDGIGRAWLYLGHERIARALMQIGTAYTDEGQPELAEEALREAVVRLEDVERQLGEQGATERDLAPFRRLRAATLVSLAVNANVRLDAPEKALEYYERAYALRHDEFMTALLACYRARSGRVEEARELLRRVRPGPGTWYNLACTHALLGDVEEALDLLETELRENHGSEGSRRRQQEWARADPDLASLRQDPRFLALTEVQD